MKIIYIKRLALWLGLLAYSLSKFWIRNPQETIAILSFIIEKIIAFPRFLSRNVLLEKHHQEFENFLTQTAKLYKKYGKNFNPKSPSAYKKLDKILPDKAQLLYFLVRKLKPSIVVETGVAVGKSSGYILQAMNDNKYGTLYSVDLPFQWYIYGNHKLHLDSLPAGKMSGYLIPEELRKRWKFILGNTCDKLSSLLRRLGRIDIFFHDSEHTDKTMLFEFNQSWPYIQQGGLLLSDDISYTKAFDDFAKLKTGKKLVFKDLGILFKTI